MQKLKVGLLFGGCSGEHEVSIISARAIAQALTTDENQSRYELLPFYIQKNGIWCDAIAQKVLESMTPSQLETASASSDARDRWQFPSAVSDVDVWFPVLHGPNGEDGTVQGLLTLMQVPFVGSGVLGAALGMDKVAMKQIFAQADLPQVKYVAIRKSVV